MMLQGVAMTVVATDTEALVRDGVEDGAGPPHITCVERCSGVPDMRSG